ncbi:MAG: helix-turn-helix transcriptional regulator [Alphaproteobacteria bacterium]|nr:helix-turn-helix transcriptional regulator [Alphaproteobacteria bacterium]MBU1514820.1 helix-turn-helix transcriptional regulator [Alphaproteobacteria bacterium]MBU2093951.1 helix-turn-helix transcriptional regulator [Alphaproteobacteria bacterium]MBU2153378.1 helix-turn-helix transcriptional regulator [Alphaproteobacteria bacterium]MBU2309806.1 helix-turn-helix transcriptional regulator [Alphaproteobacteria bacterium]
MPFTDTGVNTVTSQPLSPFPRTPRRPNPVFSDEYGVVREVLIGARREAGLSQRALAARLGKTGSHVAMIERGQRRVDLLEFCRIADSLGISAHDLVGRIAQQLETLKPAA